MSTPVIRQAVGNATSGTNATVTLGAGTQVGDLLIIFHGNDFNVLSGLLTPTSSQTLNNMTLQASSDQGSNQCHIKVWSAVVTVAGTQTVTCNVTASGEEVGAHVAVINGTTVNIGAFLDGTPTGGGSTVSTSSLIAPAVTTTTADALLLCMAIIDGTTGTPASYTPPAGMTEQTDATDGAFSGSTVASLVLSSAGSTGTKTFTATRSGAYATASIALQGGAVAADPGPLEWQYAPGLNGPGGMFVNTPAIDDPAVSAVNVNDTTNPQHTLITGDTAPALSNTDTNPAHTVVAGDPTPAVSNTDTNPAHTLVAGDPAGSVATNDTTAPATTHQAFDATVSSAVIVNVAAELTNHTLVAGDPTVTQTTTDGTNPAHTFVAGAPTLSTTTTDTTAPALGHQTLDATVSTAVILNVNAPDTANTHTAADPTPQIGATPGAGATGHQTFDAVASTSASGTDTTNPANTHTTGTPTAGISEPAQSVSHTFVTSDVTSTQTTPAEAPQVAHSTFNATVTTTTVPPAHVTIDTGLTWGATPDNPYATVSALRDGNSVITGLTD